MTMPFVATSLALLFVGASAAWYVHRLNQEVSHLLADHLECAVACEQLVSHIRAARTELDRFVDTGDRSHLKTAVAERTRTVELLDQATQWAPNQHVRDLLDRTRQSHDQFFARFTVVTANEPGATLKTAVRSMSRQLDAELLTPVQDILAYNQRTLLEHGYQNREVADRVGLGLIALGTCGAMAGLLSGFGVTRNLTRRIDQRERETLRAEQLAAVGQLAAGLAHELRNPLTSMKILMQTANEQGTAAALTGRDLVVFQEEVERLEQLTKSFLDFARVPSLEKSIFDVRELVEQTIRLVSGPATRCGVSIDCQAGAQPIYVEADPIQIRQVLLNLLLNALDAVSHGGAVQVMVQPIRAGWASEKESKWLEIDVVDSGPGVSEAIRERIFQPFVSTKDTGTGLGLAISRQIVAAHQGSIEVENNQGGGARFTVRMPIVSRSGKGSAENGMRPEQPEKTP